MSKVNEPLMVLGAEPAVRAAGLTRERTCGCEWPRLLALALLWLSLFWVISTDWSINSQYTYGWMVPVLGLVVYRERWNCRPPAAPGRATILPLLASGLLLLVALPIRLIEEANPEWRLILWFHAGWVVVFSLLLLGYAGGPSWIRHFAFALAFPLISVPLPTVLEQEIIQRLTRMV